MSGHRIRLRRPWHCEAVTGGVIWRRGFGRPGGLGPNETVWLCVEAAGALRGCAVTLNGEMLDGPLHPDFAARYDVTQRLRPRNEVRILLEGAAPADRPDEPPGDVYLEICS